MTEPYRVDAPRTARQRPRTTPIQQQEWRDNHSNLGAAESYCRRLSSDVWFANSFQLQLLSDCVQKANTVPHRKRGPRLQVRGKSAVGRTAADFVLARIAKLVTREYATLHFKFRGYVSEIPLPSNQVVKFVDDRG